jgi:uncharacterized protein
MTVELRPLGVACNIQCQYCYQNPQRDAGNVATAYDLDRMKAAIEAEGGPFSLFGGEALLLPLNDLENLWAWGLQRYGRNSIQTNATLITAAHIRLFRKYKVHVGISLDGPDELNDARWNGTLEKTRTATARAQENVEKLCALGMPPSLILTLHRANAARERLPRLYDWVRHLHHIGLRSVRLHLLEVESKAIRAKYALSTEENISVLLGFLALERELKTMRFDLFADMRRMLRGQDQDTTCVWTGCDSYTTRAVRGVEGHGQRSNCGRTNKDGIDFVKSDRAGFERYLALYATPQEDGGCHGCKFFLMCKGHCPGTAIDGDWRNRTEHCEIWKHLYAVMESELLARGEIPISCDRRRLAIEHAFLRAWSAGRNTSMVQILRRRAPPGRQRRWPRPRLQYAVTTLASVQKSLRSWSDRDLPFTSG